ncbi:MAG: methylthioribulose 1-phosphate dehydratase [Cyanobacteriota bacterium]|jgi:methylthioribulose-1-phosphate dehydratase
METRSEHQAAQAEELCAAMESIHRRGWCEGTGGNFSCVISRDPVLLLMAPSGVDKGSVRPGDLIVVDEQCRVREGKGKASAETKLHLAIVDATEAGAVLHTHSQAATLLSLQQEAVVVEGLEMLKGLEGITTHACRIEIPVLENDQDLERLSARAKPLLTQAPHGLLIGGHGLYAWGKDLATARRHLEILEFLLEQTWRSLLLSAIRNQ